jgi:hypothetical protein
MLLTKLGNKIRESLSSSTSILNLMLLPTHVFECSLFLITTYSGVSGLYMYPEVGLDVVSMQNATP